MVGPGPLTFLSWNLALMSRAATAPVTWTQERIEATIRGLVLDRSPDLVLYQELPGIVPFVETHDMIRANPRSHSGNLAILVGNHLADESIEATTVHRCGVLATFADRNLTVANVHLAPGRAGAAERLAQLRAIRDASPTSDLVVIGDTNTRLDEEPALAELGFGHPRPPGPTWDSRRNRFHADGPSFIGYFTRALTAGGVTVTDQAVEPGRVREDGRVFHLSDHFGLTGTVVPADHPR